MKFGTAYSAQGLAGQRRDKFVPSKRRALRDDAPEPVRAFNAEPVGLGADDARKVKNALKRIRRGRK